MLNSLFRIAIFVLISVLISACGSIYLSDDVLFSKEEQKYPENLSDVYVIADRLGEEDVFNGIYFNLLAIGGGDKLVEIYFPNEKEKEKRTNKTGMDIYQVNMAPLDGELYLVQLKKLGNKSWQSVPVKFNGDSFIVPNIDSIDVDAEVKIAQDLGITLKDDSSFRSTITNAPNADALRKFFTTMTEERRGVTDYAKAVSVDEVPEGLVNTGRRFAFEKFGNFTKNGVRGAAVDETFIRYFNKLDEQGSAFAAFYLARIYANGWFVEQDYDKAKALADRAIGRGLQQANLVLGYLATYGLGGNKDPEKGFRYYLNAALAGDPRAQLFVGLAYNSGNGVQKDTNLGTAWLKKAAKQKNSDAYVYLGRLYAGKYQGISEFATDDKEAFEWFRKAAFAKNPEGHSWLAWAYASGTGVKQNQKEASRQYLLGAKLGDAWSQFQIGERLIAGNGIPLDKNAGRAWLEKAAEAGVKKAAESLSRLDRPAGKEKPAPDDKKISPETEKKVDEFLDDLKKLADEELARIDDDIKKLCGGRICEFLPGKNEIIYQSLNKNYWYYSDGRLAPQEIWPKR